MNWINVKDQMPEYNEPVLVYCGDSAYKHDGLKITVAAYISKEELENTYEEYDGQDEDWYAEVGLFNSDYGSWLMGEKVTHWMPLPEPPKEEKEEG